MLRDDDATQAHATGQNKKQPISQLGPSPLDWAPGNKICEKRNEGGRRAGEEC